MIHPTSSTDGEVVLAFPGPLESIPPVTEFRSTWVVSSLEGLRAHGHLDRYLQLLDQRYVDALLNCVAGAWLPIPAVRAHYAACQALALSPEAVARMARAGGTVRRAWHAQIIAAAQRPGADIWAILAQLQKLWLRGANGGATAVIRTGSTRARVEYVGCELFDIPYFRAAVGAVLSLLGTHMCPGLRVTSVEGAASGTATYLLEWT